MLARALKPFVLRRTKDQVARDLPARLEQTLIIADNSLIGTLNREDLERLLS
jgi:SNF2 family DNA or RNA helicase